jgi:2-iminobutanoate/2-iminopropanoate deaminase
MRKEAIKTAKSHPPHATYSQAIKAGNFVFAGLGPFDLEGKPVAKDIKLQTKVCMENLTALLTEAGTTLDNLVEVTVYALSHKKYYRPFDEVYRQYVKKDPPARVFIEVAGLPKGALVIMSVTAIIPEAA